MIMMESIDIPVGGNKDGAFKRDFAGDLIDDYGLVG